MNEKEIGRAIRDRRKQLSLSQDQLALLASTSRSAISTVENGGGNRGITLGNLLGLAKVLGLEVRIEATP